MTIHLFLKVQKFRLQVSICPFRANLRTISVHPTFRANLRMICVHPTTISGSQNGFLIPTFMLNSSPFHWIYLQIRYRWLQWRRQLVYGWKSSWQFILEIFYLYIFFLTFFPVIQPLVNIVKIYWRCLRFYEETNIFIILIFMKKTSSLWSKTISKISWSIIKKSLMAMLQRRSKKLNANDYRP